MEHLFGEEPIVLLEALRAAVAASSRCKATTRVQVRSREQNPANCLAPFSVAATTHSRNGAVTVASLEFDQDCYACDKRRYRRVCDIDARHRDPLRKVNAAIKGT